MYFNFVLCSITFLQSYIPLVIEANKRNIKCNFFLRSNVKQYADPYFHIKKIKTIFKKYNISKYEIKDIINFKGIVFVIDGDIYGNSVKCMKNTYKKYIQPYHKIISLIENFNFYFVYNNYVSYVNHILFPNKIYAEKYNCISKKNIFFGVPKYDVVFNNVYKKYNLNENNKYILLFYPRFERGRKKYKNFDLMYENIIFWLKKMGYKIIIKNREKIKIFNKSWDYFFDDGDLYPHVSLELLHISDLVVFFGSSVIEECVMMKKPFIEIVLDDVDRFSFLRNESYSYVINNEINETVFIKNVKKLIKKEHQFEKIISKYLFNKNNVCKKIIDFALK